ncbi:MAG: HAMP domain-containing sensor histidine kinase [Candidatus Gastranaerophilaceae bacterium]|jgi:signal transduction histidine kinase
MLKAKSLFEYFITEKTSLYTKQTVLSLFRTLLETVIDSRNNSLVIYKIDDTEGYHSILNRLVYTNSTVFTFNQDLNNKNINILKSDKYISENFLLIYSDRFSVVFVWENADTQGFYKSVCSLNAELIQNFYDHIYKTTSSKELNECLSGIRLDRRGNLIFDSILNKLLVTIEDSQRDLICAGTELQEHQNNENEDFKKVLKIYAHELRNPLGMMGVYAKIIQKCVKSIQDGNINDNILNSLDSAARINQKAIDNIDAMLFEMSNYSKELDLKIQSEKIYNLLNDMIGFILPSFRDKDIVFGYDIEKVKNIKVNIDKHKIYQVLLNLLKNALEASTTNKRVELSAGMDQNKLNLFIEVKDTGSGIPQENKEKIFTPFFTTKKEGSGIGLSLSKKIIEAHNGKLTLKETGKNGSVFRIELPL